MMQSLPDDPILKVEDLHAWYGKSHILRGVGFQVGRGEIVSLLGRNGAGRTTICRAVMGELSPQGAITFKGQSIAGLDSHRIARLGIGYVPENRDVFPTLTVLQNLELGMKTARSAGRWRIDDLFSMFPPLEARAEVPGGALSGGEQQMLTIGRTLMGDPDLIMVDEPTEGLAPRMVQRIAELLREIRKRGVAVLLVEQKLRIALDLADRVYVLGKGRVMFEGTPDAFRRDDRVRKDWLEV